VVFVIVFVAMHQLPVLSHNNPAFAIPPLENAQAILVPANASIATPEPATRTVEMILLPEMPVRTDLAPLVECATTVEMMSNAPVTAPRPAGRYFTLWAADATTDDFTTQDTFALQHPMAAVHLPLFTLFCLPPVDLQAVDVIADAPCATPCAPGTDRAAAGAADKHSLCDHLTLDLCLDIAIGAANAAILSTSVSIS
jgi:hypothetical protein